MRLSASVVPGEVNTTNDNKQADSLVTLLYNGHDIAVITVGPSKTVVGQGYSMSITVIVKDYGVFSETFNTTVLANTTAIYVLTVGLQSGTSATLSFTWNTSGFAKGNYTISAYAWPVLGEVYTTDNTLSNGRVVVTIAGDVDASRRVEMIDLWLIQKHYGAVIGTPKYDGNCDVDDSGRIDMIDLWITQKNYGKTDP